MSLEQLPVIEIPAHWLLVDLTCLAIFAYALTLVGLQVRDGLLTVKSQTLGKVQHYHGVVGRRHAERDFPY